MSRLSFDEYFLSLAFVAALRSEDPNRKVGAVCANSKNQILATGYNGFLPGVDGSSVLAGPDDMRRKLIFHAEQNALLLCPKGSVHTLAVTSCCCEDCARLVGNHGVKRVIYGWPYDREKGLEILNYYGIEVKRIIPQSLNPYFDGVFNERPNN